MTDPERTPERWSTQISLPTDEEGFFGRECPDLDCHAYYKLQIGEYQTARAAHRLTCPICGTTAGDEDFHTAEQQHRIEAGLHELAQGVIDEAIRDVFGRSPSVRRSPAVTFRYQPPPTRFQSPLPTYVERATIRAFSCSRCSHRTVAYDLVSFCPYCGENTPPRPILDENLAAMGRLVDLIEQMPDEVRQDIEAVGGATAQVERALVGACAAFQHFAQQVHAGAGKEIGRDRNPWQNPERLAKEWRRSFSHDPLAALNTDNRSALRLGFARRHVLEHKGGRVDQTYLDETGEHGQIGRRLRIRAAFVRDFFGAAARFADELEHSAKPAA
jgi:uncharacterized Zn finger protein (UPF0148 family)